MAFLGTFKAKTRVIWANMDQKLKGFCERGSPAGAEKVTPLHIHSSNEARATSLVALRLTLFTSMFSNTFAQSAIRPFVESRRSRLVAGTDKEIKHLHIHCLY